jgi:hypothetical protein
MIQVRCGMGLGNRVAAMANGLSRSAEIRFVWRVNSHCPAAHADVFPAGIPGVEFVDSAPPAMATRWGPAWCYDWHAAADRTAADAAYQRIIHSLAGRPLPDAPEVAILGRFHRNPAGDPIRLADAAMRLHSSFRWDRVFLLSDMHRETIAARLAQGGLQAVMPSCGPLATDLQRSRSDVLAYASDWLTLLSARYIVALDGPASALHPARADGRRIIYA